MELLQKENFYNIHVKDILERDHISRTSFYKYYQDKYDLLDKIETDLLLEFDREFLTMLQHCSREQFVNGIPFDPAIYTEIFRFINDRYSLISSLFGPNGDGMFAEKVIRHIQESPYLQLDAEKLDQSFDPVQFGQVNIFLSHGYLGLITNWIREGERRRSAEEMGSLLAGIVQTFFSIDPKRIAALRQSNPSSKP